MAAPLSEGRIFTFDQIESSGGSSHNGPIISPLPFEIIDQIFSYLNFKDLISVSIVNKKWNHVLSNEALWKSFVKKYFFRTREDLLKKIPHSTDPVGRDQTIDNQKFMEFKSEFLSVVSGISPKTLAYYFDIFDKVKEVKQQRICLYSISKDLSQNVSRDLIEEKLSIVSKSTPNEIYHDFSKMEDTETLKEEIRNYLDDLNEVFERVIAKFILTYIKEPIVFFYINTTNFSGFKLSPHQNEEVLENLIRFSFRDQGAEIFESIKTQFLLRCNVKELTFEKNVKIISIELLEHTLKDYLAQKKETRKRHAPYTAIKSIPPT